MDVNSICKNELEEMTWLTSMFKDYNKNVLTAADYCIMVTTYLIQFSNIICMKMCAEKAGKEKDCYIFPLNAEV